MIGRRTVNAMWYAVGACQRAIIGIVLLTTGVHGAAQTMAEEALGATDRLDNDPALKAAHQPYSSRFALEMGDQAGGPVRYNTRFPTTAEDPNPSSYYHAQTFFGANFERSFTRGAFQVGLMSRRDFAHRGIERRSLVREGAVWQVDSFQFRGEALSIGWVFGTLYREALWKASLAAIADRAQIRVQLSQDPLTTDRAVAGSADLLALSLRARSLWRVVGSGSLDWHVGPEIHVPVYSRESYQADPAISSWFKDTLALKNSAALGLTTELGFRF